MTSKHLKLKTQPRWFDQHKWLYYSAHANFKGGWCLSCVLFLTDVEKERLGAFVRAPFRNYNKSKELLDDMRKEFSTKLVWNVHLAPSHNKPILKAESM